MISFEEVHKTYRSAEGDVTAVRGISFEVPAQEFFTLLGPSGCGKTTTLRMLAGLEKPDSGRISIAGRTVFCAADRIDVPAHRRSISMVFQSYAIWPHMTVFENVAYPLRVKKAPRPEIAERVERVLALVGLAGIGTRHATRLSGGQQQRVALARALVADPEVLLLDEPLSNLDAQLRAQMRIELKDLQSRIGVTTVYVTHDQQEALAMSDELLVMNEGEVVQRGTPKRIYHRPKNRFVAEFIGAANLLHATLVRRIGDDKHDLDTPLGEIRGFAPTPLDRDHGSVLLSIRPESLTIGKLDAAADAPVPGFNVLRGTLERLVFFGETTECTVRIAGVVLRVKGTIRGLDEGDDVFLQVAHERCVVLPDESVGPTV